MRTIHFAIAGLSLMGFVLVGCAADTEEPALDSTSDELRGAPAGQCQSSDGRTVLGTECHDQSALQALCERHARPWEEFVSVKANGLRQDGKWKTATCRIEARTVLVRCCDAS